MQARKNIEQRVKVLYLLFFVVIIVSLGFTFTGTTFKTGFQDARNELIRNTAHKETKYVFSVPNRTQDFDYSHELQTKAESSVDVLARPSAMDVLLSSDSWSDLKSWKLTATNIMLGLSTLFYLGVFVIILMIISSLKKSLKVGNIFNRRYIKLTRAIGLLLIAASVSSTFFQYFETSYLADIIDSRIFIVDTSIKFHFSEIITGVLILFIAEVFAIGSDLAEEQTLTI